MLTGEHRRRRGDRSRRPARGAARRPGRLRDADAGRAAARRATRSPSTPGATPSAACPRGRRARRSSTTPTSSCARATCCVLEEIRGPATGLRGDADPRHRHPVRLTGVNELVDPVEGDLAVVEIRWDPADALPVPAPAHEPARPRPAAGRGQRRARQRRARRPRAHALAAPARRRPAGRPAVAPAAAGPGAHPRRAADGRGRGRCRLRPRPCSTPARAVAALRLSDGEDAWDALPDLLGAAGDTKAVVVELERDGDSCLRFGDGVNGSRPGRGDGVRARIRAHRRRCGRQRRPRRCSRASSRRSRASAA